jgi:hypothetical protein
MKVEVITIASRIRIKLYEWDCVSNVMMWVTLKGEPVDVWQMGSLCPGIDSQLDGPVRQPYFVPAHQATYVVWRNRFLGSSNIYKYWLFTLLCTYTPQSNNVFSTPWNGKYKYDLTFSDTLRRGIIHKVPEGLCLRRNCAPHPLPLCRVCLPPGSKGGSNTLLRVLIRTTW